MKVYMNHDGGIDDLASLTVLLQMPGVELLGVSVIPADCYLEPAVDASRKIIDRFGNPRADLAVARSNSRGKNPFPHEWRLHPYHVDALPILNEAGEIQTPVAKEWAHEQIIRVLRGADEPVTLLFTGPLTDLARALEQAPDIRGNVKELVWMGGSFTGAGNVMQPDHDGSAEWNAYWDPEAVKTVWDSGIPIVLFPLKATNQVPLTLPLRRKWAGLRKYPAIDFIGQCYALCPPLVHVETNSTYYFWDVLTTSYVGTREHVRGSAIRCIVHTEGPSQGRIEPSESGREVTVIEQVDAERFYDLMIEWLKNAK